MPNKVKLGFKLRDKCTIHRMPVFFNNAHLNSISHQVMLSAIFVIKFIKNVWPDMIYARQNYLGIIPILLARMYRIPYFAEINGITKKTEYNGSNIKLRIKALFEQLCLKFANIIITPSKTLKERIINLYKTSPDKIYVVHNGVNDELFRPRKNHKIMREALGIDNNDFVIGFVGSMGEWQGIEVLKKAIKFITSEVEYEKIKFLIVGDYIKDSNLAKINAGLGEGRKNILDFIKKNFLDRKVIYHRYVPYTKSAGYMNICDVLVAPYTNSYFEYGGGSPMKLYAYLGCGKSVIVSDLGEFTDAINIKKYGAAFLVPPYDSQALAKAILHLKKNRKLREKLEQNSRHFVLKERRWFHSCLKILSIYNEKFIETSKNTP